MSTVACHGGSRSLGPALGPAYDLHGIRHRLQALRRPSTCLLGQPLQLTGRPDPVSDRKPACHYRLPKDDHTRINVFTQLGPKAIVGDFKCILGAT